jgi:hypothetical protein
VTASVSGSFQTVTRNESTFRSDWKLALMAQALDVQALDVTTRPYLERLLNLDIIEEPYTAVVRVKVLVQTNQTNLIAAIGTAATKAGSYEPAVTLTSLGQAPQAAIPPIEGLLGSLLSGVSDVIEAVGATAKAAPKIVEEGARLPTLLVVGIVGIVALIAFGPSFKGLGGSVGGRL